jgi:PAS domain-containing protein
VCEDPVGKIADSVYLPQVRTRQKCPRLCTPPMQISQAQSPVEEQLASSDSLRLEIERQRFVALADNSKDFISMCDMEGKPFYANKAALNVVGLDSLED